MIEGSQKNNIRKDRKRIDRMLKTKNNIREGERRKKTKNNISIEGLKQRITYKERQKEQSDRMLKTKNYIKGDRRKKQSIT